MIDSGLMTNVSEDMETKPKDLKDSEWTDQFNNLSTMLERYLNSSKTETPSMSQILSFKSLSKPIPILFLSPNPGKALTHPEEPKKISSPSSILQNLNVLRHKSSISSASTAANKRHLRTNSASSPQQTLGNISKLPYQPSFSGPKKLSPNDRHQQQQIHVILKTSPDRIYSKDNRPSSQWRGPQRIMTQESMQSKTTHLPQSHIDYGPRNRLPYGQAGSASKSAHKDRVSHMLGTPPQYKPISQSYIPNRNSSQSSSYIVPSGRSQKSTQSQINPILNSNIAQNQTSTTRNQTSTNLPGSKAPQKKYWLSPENPHKKQEPNQSLQVIPSQDLPVQSTPPTSKFPKYRSLSASAGYENVLTAHKFALSRKTHFFSSLTWPSIAEVTNRALSPISKYQNIGNLINPNSITPRGGVKYFRTSTRSVVELPLTNAEKIATLPTMNFPDTRRNSAVSGGLKRDKSTEDLVEENLQKIERSAILQKLGEDQVAEVEQDHLIILNTQEIEAKAKEIVQTALKKKLIPQLTLETAQKERDSTDSNSRSIGKEIAYGNVEENNADGSRYEGEKEFGKRHGTGVFVNKEGFKYDGHWEEGFMKGYGTLWLNETKIYEGEWFDNVFNGRGTAYNHEVSINPDFKETDFSTLQHGWVKYEGMFSFGAKQGLGTLLLANGDTYVGNFENDVVHGRGSYTAKDSKPFIGLWKENILVEKF